jgi:uncharacterized membrane protein (DUF485 family)
MFREPGYDRVTMSSTPQPPPDAGARIQAGDWEHIAHSDAFKDLMAAKARFIVPATLFFVAYYFALPVLVGYAPKFMSTPVVGVVNLAYLFALSQFFVAWIIAWLYTRAANRFDEMGRNILKSLDEHNRKDKA